MSRSASAVPRRRAVLPVLALIAACVSAEEPAAPFSFDKPVFLSGPEVSSSLMGSTYAYTARSRQQDMRLLVTVMRADEIRGRFGALSDVQCINLFLEEIRQAHERFFVASMSRPLAVGPAEFLRFRWTGDKSGTTMTGVLSCGVLQGHYYVVHFVDELRSATRSFPVIRASLKTLVPRRIQR